jgi:hypothetical protein
VGGVTDKFGNLPSPSIPDLPACCAAVAGGSADMSPLACCCCRRWSIEGGAPTSPATAGAACCGYVGYWPPATIVVPGGRSWA